MQFDLEKVIGVTYTGVNTKGGDLITVKMTTPRIETVAANTLWVQPARCHIVLEAEQSLDIYATYVNVAD